MTGGGRVVNMTRGLTRRHWRPHKKKGRSIDRPLLPMTRIVARSLAPGERRHRPDEEARLVVARVRRDVPRTTRVRAREVREQRQVARGEVALDGVVEDFVAGEIPVVAPRITGMQRGRELGAEGLRVLHLGVLRALVRLVEVV